MRRGGSPVMSRSAQADAAGVGTQLAAQHVEAGGFAGAVRADQRQHLPGRDTEGDAVDRPDAAEAPC